MDFYLALIIAFTVFCVGVIGDTASAAQAAVDVKSSEKIILAKNGAPAAVIVVDPFATEAEKFAAEDLKNHLDQMTGGSFQIVSPEYAGADKRILVGLCDDIRNLLPEIDFDNLPPDTIVIKAVAGNIVLAGDRPRGTIYAVYTFLEEYLGCNWWDQDNFYIPSNKNVSINADLSKVYTPPFSYRSVWYKYMTYEKGPFGARLKLNGVIPQPDTKYGGHITPVVSGHSMHYILPPNTYFESHPEWYGMRNGERQAILPNGQKNQLCLSNAEMRKEFVNNILERLKKYPDAQLICIEQEDGSTPCRCQSCLEMDKIYGGQSGTLLAFVNLVADEIKAAFPKVAVETLAYQWSINPPTAPAAGDLAKRENVQVKIAPINEDFGAPWGSERNARVNNLFQKWKSYANLAIYDYSMNYHQPLILLPNWTSIGQNIKYYAQNSVKSVICQGDISNDGASFSRFRAWLIAHLLWDPSADQKTLTERFLNGYYGAAGKYLKDYIDLTQTAASQNITFMPIWSDDPAWMTSEQLKRGKLLFDQAEKAVSDDQTLLQRVKIARLGFDLQLLQSRLVLPEIESWVSESYRDTLAANFVELAASTRNQYIAETIPFPEDYLDVLTAKKEIDLSKNLLPQLRKPAWKPVTVETFGITASDWSDIQETQFQLTAKNRTIVSDPEASNSAAVQISPSVIDWILQTPIFSRNCIGENVDLYVSAKIAANASNGAAFRIGVYNLVEGAMPLDRTVNISELNTGAYTEIKIGSFSPSEKQVIFCSPSGNEEVLEITVDRFFLVRK